MLSPNHQLNNRYIITRTIGKGGMGAVYEAIDIRLGNQVAVKQTLSDPSQTDIAFENEARLLAHLRHPALPVVSDFFTDNGSQFLVMQYFPGDDLATLQVQRSRPFAVLDVMRWADTLLDALEYLHSQKPPVIHRDIKPHNLKLDNRGDIVLLDFGIAKSGSTTTQLGGKLQNYTLPYAPLEQIQQQETTPSSDIYALGATLYELLTRAVPPSALDRVAAQFNSQPDPLLPVNAINPVIPVGIAHGISRALALQAQDRFQSAGELRDVFKQVLIQNGLHNIPKHKNHQVAANTTPNQPFINTGATTVLNSSQAQSVQSSAPRISSQATQSPTPVPHVQARVAQQFGTISQTHPAVSPQTQQASSKPFKPLSAKEVLGYWLLANTIAGWFLIPLSLLIAMFKPLVILFLCYGVILGFAQWLVLRRTEMRRVALKWWLITSIAGPIAFFMGGAIYDVLKFLPTISEILGYLVGGAALGAAQRWYIEKINPIKATWIIASALGWVVVGFLSTLTPFTFAVFGLVSSMPTAYWLYAKTKAEQSSPNPVTPNQP